MDCEKESSNSNGASERSNGRRGFWAVFSCFGGGSDTLDDEVAEPSRGKRVAVVPVDSSGGESDQKSTHGDAVLRKRERKKDQMDRHKSFKDKSKGTNTTTKPHLTQELTTVYQEASKLKAQPKPALLYLMLDPVQTQSQIRTSHPGSPEPVIQLASKEVFEENLKKNGYGPYTGLCVLTFALAMMVLGGVTFGVICMSVWFCVLYALLPGTVPVRDGTSQKGSTDVDVSTEEYKKMVVLRGFLERDKRKPLIDNR